MRRLALAVAAIATLLLALPSRPEARSDTLMDLLAGRDTPACPRYQQTPQDKCNIVVKRPGGNPTQDMTGSIGHAKSYQSGGGRANPLICYLPGTR